MKDQAVDDKQVKGEQPSLVHMSDVIRILLFIPFVVALVRCEWKAYFIKEAVNTLLLLW